MSTPHQAPGTPHQAPSTTHQAPGTDYQAPAAVPVYHRGTVSSSREQNNPLRALTIARAISLMEAAQRGEFLELQWLYWFVEQTEPILYALQERRYGRLAEMDWDIKIIPKQRRRRNFDQSLAEEQAIALAEMYDRIDNLKEASEHLASGTFRLYAHLNIQHDATGEVNHLEPLDQWNLLRDGMFGAWWWNPDATHNSWRMLPASNKLVPEDFIIRTTARHINRPALIKYIRKNLGEKDWSGFLELYGIPTPIVTMPPNATEPQKALYEGAASAIAAGRPVALPNGSDAKFPSEIRGNSPFREYLAWCDEQMVLLGTGGLLSMLAMPQGLGNGASENHDAAFKSISAAEAFRISELYQRYLDKPKLQRDFPGKPILAYFELAAAESTDPGTVLEHAVKAKNAGYQMDPAELSENTGYKLTLAPVAPNPLPFPPPTPGIGPTLNTDPDRAAASKAQRATAQAAAAGAAQTAQELDNMIRDWFARFEELAAHARTEEEFLAAAEATIAEMPDQLLTEENLKRIAAPMEGALGAAILNTIAARPATPDKPQPQEQAPQ